MIGTIQIEIAATTKCISAAVLDAIANNIDAIANTYD